jgi:hypothetical protein
MVSVILSTYWVRPSLTLVEDCYDDAPEFLLVNYGRTLGLNSPTLRRMRTSLEYYSQQMDIYLYGRSLKNSQFSLQNPFQCDVDFLFFHLVFCYSQFVLQ